MVIPLTLAEVASAVGGTVRGCDGLRTLVAMAGAHRRSWAVLGPLAELGEAETEVYREIGALAVRLGVDRLVVVGEQARSICWAAQDGAAAEHRAPEADTPGTRGRHAGRAA